MILTICRYVERNPLRAQLVQRAEDWPWSSLRCWMLPSRLPWLHSGPVPRPAAWMELVQAPHSEAELAALRRSVERCTPYGSPAWVEQTAEQFGLQSNLHPPGRPRQRGSCDADHGGLFPPKQP